MKTRLDFIGKELDRMESLEKEFIGKVEDKRKNIIEAVKNEQKWKEKS